MSCGDTGMARTHPKAWKSGHPFLEEATLEPSVQEKRETNMNKW
jgi:Zn/Cd-binding protein ZinT